MSSGLVSCLHVLHALLQGAVMEVLQYLLFFTISANMAYVYQSRKGKKTNRDFLC